MIERLTKALQPERAGEEEAIEHAAKGFNADILADMVERATQREYLAGIEAGTKKIIQVVMEQAAADWTNAHGRAAGSQARAHDMS